MKLTTSNSKKVEFFFCFGIMLEKQPEVMEIVWGDGRFFDRFFQPVELCSSFYKTFTLILYITCDQ